MLNHVYNNSPQPEQLKCNDMSGINAQTPHVQLPLHYISVEAPSHCTMW